MLNEPLPLPVAVAPLFRVNVQLPDATTLPLMVVLPPLQILASALVICAVGLGSTDTGVVVLLQPEIASVNVNVALPCCNPVTTPALVTEAINALLLVQLPPLLGVN